MPPSIPCPNPACTQAFALDAIKGAASLVCPKCGTVYQFRSDAEPFAKSPPARRPPTPAPPALPVAPPVGPAATPRPPTRPTPTAASAPLAVPIAKPVAPTLGPAFTPLPRRDGRRPRGSWANTIVLGVVFVFLLAGGAFGVYWLYLYNLNRSAPPIIENEEGRGNFVFQPPGGAWEEDGGAALKFRAVQYAYRRTDPGNRNNFALYYRDYKDRTPSDAEMVSEALIKLRNYFRNVEYDVQPRTESDRLADRPALRLVFQGVSPDPENVVSGGEVWMITYRGFAYWFFTWGPQENDQGKDVRARVAAEWPKLRKRLQLRNYREGWKEVPPRTLTFHSEKAPYQVDFNDKVWERQREPKDSDPRAELALLGYDPRLKQTDRHASNAATALFLLQDKADSLDAAVKKAKDDLLERQKPLYADTTLEEARDESIGKNAATDKVGGLAGKVVKLLMKNAENRQRYVELGVVNLPGNVLVVECECAYDQRDLWQQEFQPLLNRVAPLKAR
jgi:hypothetical protein